jgi:peptide/nickel transport system substrate-binding protein
MGRYGKAVATAAMTALLLPSLAAAQGTGQSLTIAVGAPVTSLDPHYHQLSPNNAVADMIFDGLVNRDAHDRNRPGLAIEWHAVDPTTWEFKLRPDVRFHNGNAFTAEDVAFTLARVPRVPNSPSSFALYTRPIQAVEIVDEHTIRLKTAVPYPLMPTDIANLRIIDKETAENATTEDFNAGRAAQGTGPWRVLEHRNGDRIEFARNDNYWGGPPAFARVTYRMITNDATRTAALLAGDVDFIDQVPTADLARLRREPRVTLSQAVGLRIIFLGLDFSRGGATPFITDNDGKPIEPNPLKDVRVRRALSVAIDRGAIVERVMEGAATPSGQFLPEGSFGYVPDLAAPRPDPNQAKRLLAEAGFPQGFRITLHSPNDRYINDARIAQAIGQMWTRIGLRTQVEAQTWPTFIARAARQELSAWLIGWGSSGGEASNPLRNLVATVNRDKGWGASNRGRYSNPAMDALLDRAMVELDDPTREGLLRDATRLAMEDVGIIPLHIQTNIWAMRRGLQHEARADELTRAQDIHPAAAGADSRPATAPDARPAR